MSIFSNAAKLAVAKINTAVDAEKGPSVKVNGTVENNHIVIRIPLEFAERDMRLTTPKPGRVALPFVALNLDLGESVPVTVMDDNGGTVEIYTRSNINANLFCMWKQSKSREDETD
jgi:hypothetical protein